jgi:hypothetical protein
MLAGRTIEVGETGAAYGVKAVAKWNCTCGLALAGSGMGSGLSGLLTA